ncbi:hypothetical protein Tco_0403379 [Tanacetum coccineum]
MDDPNITMEEYIRLEEEKAHRRGKVYNWETATYGKILYDEDVHDLRFVETEFPAIVLNDALTSEVTLSCEPTVSPLNDNQIDFRISFNESDDEDYTVLYDKYSFYYKIISVENLKMDSEKDNDKVNMPFFPSSEPTVSYFDDLDYFKDFEKEFPAIVYNDALTSKLDFLTEPTIGIKSLLEVTAAQLKLLAYKLLLLVQRIRSLEVNWDQQVVSELVALRNFAKKKLLSHKVRIYLKSHENNQKRASTDTGIRRVQKAKESKPEAKPEKSSPQLNPVNNGQQKSTTTRQNLTTIQFQSLKFINVQKCPLASYWALDSLLGLKNPKWALPGFISPKP